MEASGKHADPPVWDVLIVGGGPAGLAVAARLRENTPTSIFTDEEHRRYQHFVTRTYGHRTDQKKQERQRHSSPSTLILDAHGTEWMSRWNKLFATYDISHLRSPMFFHVDPADQDSLLAMAHDTSRKRGADELLELRGCVANEARNEGGRTKRRCKGRGRGTGMRRADREAAVNEHDRHDYYTPSRGLFREHCEAVVQRYGLRGVVRQDVVARVQYGNLATDGGHRGDSTPSENDKNRIFTVTTASGVRHRARVVVVAIGPGLVPNYPALQSIPLDELHRAPQVTHSMAITEFPDPHVKSLITRGEPTSILVVGGGLTSAQLSDLAIRRGVSRVWHIMRGPLKVKHFDLDLDWLGRYRHRAQAEYWQAAGDARTAMLLQARNGGSLTPLFHQRVTAHVDSGRLSLHTHTVLADLSYDADRRKWRVVTEPRMGGGEGMPLLEVDHVYLATGPAVSADTLDFLEDVRRDYPVATSGGMPCLNDRLMWRDDVPLFFNGRLAALQLGPGGPNLIGARTGAERLVWAVQDILSGGKKHETERRDSGVNVGEEGTSTAASRPQAAATKANKKSEKMRLDYVMGVGSMYDALEDTSE